MSENKNNKNKPTLTNKEFYNLMIKYRLENYDERKKILGSNQNEAEKVAYQVSQDFCTLASLTYMDKFFKTVYKAQEYVGNYEDYPIPKDNVYKEIMEKSRQIYSTLLNTYSGINTTEGRIENELNYMKRYVDNEVCKYQVNGAMDAMKALGVEKYKYICEDKYNSCNMCSKLNGKKFRLDEAQEGVNLPPIHPNCKCTIGSHIDDDNLQELQQGQESYNVSDEEEERVSLVNFVGQRIIHPIYTPYYTKKLINKFYTNNYINISGHNYKYNLNVSENPVIINDKLLNENNLTAEDKVLLDLMKKRDSCNSTVEREKTIKKAYELMMEYNDLGKQFSIDFFKEYDYYKVGRDVTKEVYDIINKYKILLNNNAKINWVLNMGLFYILVKGKARLDLKNRAPYKTNSTYIFEDEIVDNDALGNITYGYLGKYLGIPDSTLFAGGGFAQVQAGTSDKEFYDFYCDDPKDQYRIIQGIQMYKEDNKIIPIIDSNSVKNYII